MWTQAWVTGLVLVGRVVIGPGVSAQQYVVKVGAVPNPVPAGSCAAIGAKLYDAMDQRVLQLPDGTPVHSGSWDYAAAPSPEFHWRYDEPKHGYLCTRPGAGPASTVVTVAHKGLGVAGSTVVTIQPASGPPGESSGPARAAAAGAAGESAGYAPPGMPGEAPPSGAQPPTTAVLPPDSAPPAPPPPNVTPAPRGDLLDRIKAETDRQLDERMRKVDSSLVDAAGGVVGAAGGAVGRGADAVVGAAAGLVQGAVSGTERAVEAAFTGSDERAIADQLAAGRLVLPEIRFLGSSPELDPSSGRPLAALARALNRASGVFLIEAHTDSSGNAGVDQRVSEVRASVVRARLVAAGVPPDRLFAAGLGSSRPLAGPGSTGPGTRARIEVSRMQ